MWKKLGFKQIKDIWEDYNILVIGVLAVISLFLIFDIPSLMAKPETIWSSYFVNSTVTSDEAKEIVEDFQKNFLHDKDEKHEYIFDTNLAFSIDQTASGDFDQMAKFTALIAAKELDFVITEPSILEHYVSLGGFVALEEFLTVKEKEEWKEYLVYYKDEAGVEKIYALDLTDTIVGTSNSPEERKILGGIPRNSEKVSVTHQFINYLFTTMPDN